MELRDVLSRRRMVRHYTGDTVPRETLERIARTVRRAPSGGYSQGQRIIVVDDRALLDRIGEIIDEDEWIARGNEPWLRTAAALFVVCCREDDYHERYQQPDKLKLTGGVEIEWPAPYWFVDAGAAMMLILLAAIDEGLGAGVFGVTVENMQAFKELLGIPDDLAVVAGVTVGPAAPDPRWSELSSRFTQRRRPLEEVVRWNRW